MQHEVVRLFISPIDSSEITSRPPVAATISRIPRSKRSNFFNSVKAAESFFSLIYWTRLVEEENFSFNRLYLFL